MKFTFITLPTAASISPLRKLPDLSPKPRSPLEKLPYEMQLMVRDYLDPYDQLALSDALTTPIYAGENAAYKGQVWSTAMSSRHGKVRSPALLKLCLMLDRLPLACQEHLIQASPDLSAFASDEIQALDKRRKLERLDQATEVRQKQIIFLLLLAKQPSIIRLLEQKIQQIPEFKKKLRQWVDRSSTEEVGAVAAWAITVLIKAGVQFNGEDLQGVQVAGADLSYGVFDQAQLQGANLSHTQMRHIWLRQANLDKAQMLGVEFGEWPFLKQDEGCNLGVIYDLNGKIYTVNWEQEQIQIRCISNLQEVYTLLDWRVNGLFFYLQNDQKIIYELQNRSVQVWDMVKKKAVCTLVGSTSAIRGFEYLPKDKGIVSWGLDKIIRLWDAKTGKLIQKVRHSHDIQGLRSLPCGERIVFWTADNMIQMWNLSTKRKIHDLRHSLESTYVLKGAQCSPDGLTLASYGSDGVLRVWDVKTGNIRYAVKHEWSVEDVVYAPNGQQMALCVGTDVFLRDPYSGEVIRVLEGHNEPVTRLAYSSDSRRIAASSAHGQIRLWDTRNGQLCRILGESYGRLEYYIESITYMPGDQGLLSYASDHIVRIWDTKDCPPSALNGHTERVIAVACSPNGRQIASSSADGTVKLWDWETGRLVLTLRGHMELVFEAHYLLEGTQIATCSKGGIVLLWDVKTGRLIRNLKGGDNWCRIVCSPNGEQIAFRGKYNEAWGIQIWNAKMGKGRFLAGEKAVYLPDGKHIACASNGVQPIVRVYDIQTGVCVRTVRCAINKKSADHPCEIVAFAYSPDGESIAMIIHRQGSDWDPDNRAVRLWNAKTGRFTGVLRYNSMNSRYHSIQYSPDGRYIFCFLRGIGTAQLWDATTRTLLHSFDRGVDAIAFSPNSKQIAFAFTDKLVSVWDIDSKRSLVDITGFVARIYGFCWQTTATGDYLVMGGEDHSVRVWQIEQVAAQYVARLSWSSAPTALTASQASLQNVQGLSALNFKLLQQRGAMPLLA